MLKFLLFNLLIDTIIVLVASLFLSINILVTISILFILDIGYGLLTGKIQNLY